MFKLYTQFVIIFLLTLLVFSTSKSYASSAIGMGCTTDYSAKNLGCPSGYTCNTNLNYCVQLTKPAASTSNSTVKLNPSGIPNNGTVNLGEFGKGYTAATINDMTSSMAGITSAADTIASFAFMIFLAWLGVRLVIGDRIQWGKEIAWLILSLLFLKGYSNIANAIISIIGSMQDKIISVSLLEGVYKTIFGFLGNSPSDMKAISQATVTNNHAGFFGSIWNGIKSVGSVIATVVKDGVSLMSETPLMIILQVIISALAAILTWVFIAMRTIILAMMVAVAPIVAALSIIPPYRKLIVSWLKDFTEVVFWKLIISIMFYTVYEVMQTNGGKWDVGFLTTGLMLLLVILIYNTPKITHMAMHEGMSGLQEIVGLAIAASIGKGAVDNIVGGFGGAKDKDADKKDKSKDNKDKVDSNPDNFNKGGRQNTNGKSDSGNGNHENFSGGKSDSGNGNHENLGNILKSNISNTEKLDVIAAGNYGEMSEIAKNVKDNPFEPSKANALEKIGNMSGAISPEVGLKKIEDNLNSGNLSAVKSNIDNLKLNPNLGDNNRKILEDSSNIINKGALNDDAKISALKHVNQLTTEPSYINEIKGIVESSNHDKAIDFIKSDILYANNNHNISNETVNNVSKIVNSNGSVESMINSLSNFTSQYKF